MKTARKRRRGRAARSTGENETPIVHLIESCTSGNNGRGGEIRTHDLYVPNVALYQAKLRPDIFASSPRRAESFKEPHSQPWRKQKKRIRAVFARRGLSCR